MRTAYCTIADRYVWFVHEDSRSGMPACLWARVDGATWLAGAP